MKIAIDLDGVIFDTENILRVNAQIYDVMIGGSGEIAREELLAEKRYAWTKKQYDDFFENCLESVLRKAPIMPHAVKIIQTLAKKHELYVITNRGDQTYKELVITHERLNDAGINVFTKIYTHDGHTKLEHCQEEGIELMIDDLYDNVKSISDAGIPCLYYCDLVNKPIDNPIVHEVRNWGDIARYFVTHGILDASDINIDLNNV